LACTAAIARRCNSSESRQIRSQDIAIRVSQTHRRQGIRRALQEDAARGRELDVISRSREQWRYDENHHAQAVDGMCH
jgi:hypothetical protein